MFVNELYVAGGELRGKSDEEEENNEENEEGERSERARSFDSIHSFHIKTCFKKKSSQLYFVYI